ncbi:MAG: hypothetical protein EON93_00380 [Burkholderiales bacterium]|nr:MAG: hypothetical protein EON93_00380 [Burkholderiales bacterium]
MFAILQLSGPALLGRFGLLASIHLVVIYLAGFEFHAFTTRRYARHPGDRQLRLAVACHRSMLTISVPLALVSGAILAWTFNVDLTPLEMAFFCTTVAVAAVTQEIVRFLVLAKNPIYSVLIGALRTAYWQPFALIFLLHSSSLLPVLTGWAIGEVAALIWAILLLRRGIFSRVSIKSHYLLHGLWVARRFYLTATASVVQGNLERFVLQTFLGPEAVGIYSFFQNLASTLPALVQASVFNVWLPQILNHFGRQSAERSSMLRRVVRRTWLTSCALGGLIACGVILLSLLTGHQTYVTQSWVLFMLIFAQILQLWTQPLYLAMYGAHRDGAIMRLSLILLAVSLLLSISLISSFGIAGAALSQLLGSAAIALSRSAMFRLFARRGLV